MVRVQLSHHAADHLDPIFDCLATIDIATAAAKIQEIHTALATLEQNPMIGRPASSGTRELLIGRHHRGYVAQYRYVPGSDLVFVLTIRSQRQASYP
jgi:plasmid stabilization system protein ParE